MFKIFQFINFYFMDKFNFSRQSSWLNLANAVIALFSFAIFVAENQLFTTI